MSYITSLRKTTRYHCIDNSKYIYDLQRALEEMGFKQINEGVKFEYKLKKDFIESDIYKYGKLFIKENIIYILLMMAKDLNLITF